MQDRESACPHCIGGDYCTKYHRFGCVGPENCSSKEEYMSFIRRTREKAELYQ